MLDWWDSKVLVNSQLRGAFIGDVDHPELDNHIFLLYRFTGERWFTAFEHNMQDSDRFVTMYEPDKRHVMFVYDVPSYHQGSYDMFKQSKYSHIDEGLKGRIVEFHGQKQTAKVVAVMYKHESMYLDWEDKINEGLPRSQHVRIPREQEATTNLQMEIEVFSHTMLGPKPGIQENHNFLSEKEEGLDEQ